MSITATLSNTEGLSSTIGSISQVQGSVSQGNELVVTRVAVPGPQGPAGADLPIVSKSDVDATNIADGSILQFRSSDSKFVAKNELSTSSGLDFVINAGNF